MPPELIALSESRIEKWQHPNSHFQCPHALSSKNGVLHKKFGRGEKDYLIVQWLELLLLGDLSAEELVVEYLQWGMREAVGSRCSRSLYRYRL